MDNTDLIEAYLNNELLGDALLNFENKLENEPDLAEELALHLQMRSFIKENEVENLKGQVKDWMKVGVEKASPQPSSDEREFIPHQILPLGDSDESNILIPHHSLSLEDSDETINTQSPFQETLLRSQKSQKKSNIFSLNLFTKIAAGLAIVSGLSWYFFSNNTPQNLESQYLSELTNQNPSQLQGADDRSEWAQAYRDKNYKKVIGILQNKKNTTPEESYYLGLAYSADGQNNKAIEAFSVKAIQESVYAEKAEWAKALVYLKLYKKAEAKTLLNKIKNSDSQYHDSAIRLIDL